MLENIINIFRVADLRKKIAFTLLILTIYRFGAFLPAPGVDVARIGAYKSSAAQSGGILQYLQLFSGGALTNLAVFALGIMPYITSSIIMQILGVVVPKIEQWQQQGAVGQRKITQWTRYLAVAISLVQGTSFAFLLHGGGNALNHNTPSLIPVWNAGRVALLVATFTAGTALLMWFGELVTQRGIGNGMSLLIFASIVSRLPAQFSTVQAESGWRALAGVLAVIVVLLVAIVFVEQGQRRIPVQFAKRVVGRRQYGGQSTYIPLKVNQAGVIPLIFASAVLYLPLLLSFVVPSNGFRNWIDNHLSKPDQVLYLIVFGLFIIGFAYFHTAITFDPVKQADTIRKQGGFIPGIRPGPPDRALPRAHPQPHHVAGRSVHRRGRDHPVDHLLEALPHHEPDPESWWRRQLAFFGTSVLIMVGVALETMKQIDSQLTMRNYEGFLK